MKSIFPESNGIIIIISLEKNPALMLFTFVFFYTEMKSCNITGSRRKLIQENLNLKGFIVFIQTFFTESLIQSLSDCEEYQKDQSQDINREKSIYRSAA